MRSLLNYWRGVTLKFHPHPGVVLNERPNLHKGAVPAHATNADPGDGLVSSSHFDEGDTLKI